MDIKFNRAYSSHWDNIQYPIYELSDGYYLCISYSNNHRVYCLNVYTKEDFIEYGFEEAISLDYIFENVTASDINL